LTGFIGWDRACCNFETGVGNEFYTLAAIGQFLPVANGCFRAMNMAE